MWDVMLGGGGCGRWDDIELAEQRQRVDHDPAFGNHGIDDAPDNEAGREAPRARTPAGGLSGGAPCHRG
jgi:hypothetical protein